MVYASKFSIYSWETVRQFRNTSLIVDILAEDFLCRFGFDAVLAIFRSYGYGTNASEAVEKIAANKKDYHKHSFCFIICIAAAYQYL